jgi:hypothetical protein
MLFFKAVASFAAMAACIMPVLSAPVAEANTDVSSVIVKRGALNDPALTCYHEVQNKCNEINGKIDAVAAIDAKLAADICVDLQVIIDLIVALGVTLKAVIAAGGLGVPDVQACVGTVILIVNLCAALLVRIAAKLAVTVSVSVFAKVVLSLYACIQVIVNLLIDVCLGKIGGLSVIDLLAVAGLVVKLTACLAVLASACLGLGVHV